MKRIFKLIDVHHKFIKEQAELYALCIAFFSASALCFKYWEKLFYIFGGIAGICLLIISFVLGTRNIVLAEKYIERHFAVKRTWRFALFVLIYTSTVVSVGFGILFESIGI